MNRTALLGAVALLAASCSAAEAELARMEDVPLIISVDAAGEESAVYDPNVTIPVGGEQAQPDLFDQPLNTGDDPESDPPAGGSDGDGDDDDDEPAENETDGADGEAGAGDQPEEEPETGVATVQPTIVERYPHDGSAFTQGLEFGDGVLIESLGLLGESARRRVVPTTGEVASSTPLSSDLFGAGITVVDSQIIQLTWREGIAIVADLTTLIELARFTFEGEGWGLCGLDDGRLVMSNGSGLLTFRDQATFEPIGELEVVLDDAPVGNLNELECVGSSIYANVWLENDILEIDAATGDVLRVIDASALIPGDLGPDDVLNGIAYRAESETFFLTGKRWTVMYEVTFG